MLARCVSPLGISNLRFPALAAVWVSELCGARWAECEALNGEAPCIPPACMKLDREDEIDRGHSVPPKRQADFGPEALWPLTGADPLAFPNNRNPH